MNATMHACMHCVTIHASTRWCNTASDEPEGDIMDITKSPPAYRNASQTGVSTSPENRLNPRHAKCPSCGYVQPRHADGQFIAHQGYDGAICTTVAAKAVVA